VDLKKPRSSSLLTAPRRHHGRNGRSVFLGQRGEEKFSELESWVVAIARDDVQRGQQDSERKSGTERAKAAATKSRSTSGGKSVASGGKHSSNADPFAQSQADATSSQTPLPAATVDPFDPTGFNRSSSRGAGR
jgi:hypothetical protein